MMSNPRKILLRIILNRLIPHAELILSEKQAGFRKSISKVDQILNIRLIIEKHENTEESIP